MRKSFILFVFFALVLSAVSVFADDLINIQDKNEIILGVSPDFVPYSFYDESGNLTGFDVEIMKEIGRRIGVEVTPKDLAFDGLIDALNAEQIDVIGSAFGISAERMSKVNFSRTYYSGDAKFVALKKSNLNFSSSLNDFSGLKIGVQEGTVYDQWVFANIVSTGIIQFSDVYAFPTVERVKKALDDGTVDVILVSQSTYENIFEDTDAYSIFTDGLLRENYAFGLRRNSTLTATINNQLEAIINDGTAKKIADRFFGPEYASFENTSDHTESFSSSFMVPPDMTCTNAMTFIPSDFDVTTVEAGKAFSKVWRVQNSGTCVWDQYYSVEFKNGNKLGGKSTYIPESVSPGQTIDISIEMTAPEKEGNYAGFWNLRTGYGMKFGETLYAEINVIPAPEPIIEQEDLNTQENNENIITETEIQPDIQENIVIAPTDEPESVIQDEPVSRTTSSKYNLPFIKDFNASSNTGESGECTTISWKVDNASSVEILVDGNSVWNTDNTESQIELCEEIAVVGQHTIELLANSSLDQIRRNLKYTTEEKEIIPSIEYFYASPSFGKPGNTTNVYWGVTNADLVDFYVDNKLIKSGCSASDLISIYTEIQNPGAHTFSIVAKSSNSSEKASIGFVMNEK